MEYKDGAPSKETVAKAYDYLDLMHGVEAFVNAYQGASVAAIFKGFEDAGVPNNTALIFSELMDAKSLFLTANADTVYFLVNLDVTKGPIVVETPPLSLGVVDDMWFHWITDFGLPGPDRGEGGKYLFVPPGYKGELPGSGYFVQKMRTTRATMLGRSFLENNDPKPVVALIKKTLKIYPYLPGGYGTSIGSALEGKATLARTPDHKLDWAFLRPAGAGEVHRRHRQGDEHHSAQRLQLFRDDQRSGAEGARRRARPGDHGVAGRHRHREGQALQSRCANEEDPDRCGGHRNGRGPNPRTGIRARPRGSITIPTPPGSNCSSSAATTSKRRRQRSVPTGTITVNPPTGARTLNSRTAMFFYATYITPAMIMRLTGIGSQYLGAFVDSNGEYFDGGKTYKMTLPPKASRRRSSGP